MIDVRHDERFNTRAARVWPTLTIALAVSVALVVLVAVVYV